MDQQSVLVSQRGTAYRISEEGVKEVGSEDVSRIPGLKEALRDPSQHFFTTPYRAAAYVVDGLVKGEVGIPPSSFYPASPFDTFKAIELFYTVGMVVIPRFYLYPCGICNSRCPICQFQNLNRFGSMPTRERIIDFPTVGAIVKEFSGMRSGLRTMAAHVSGDGEPTEHPEIVKILRTLRQENIRVFLTSNLILHHDKDDRVLRAIAESVSMLTVSIKGLDQSTYDQYQGRSGRATFGRVLGNIERLIERLQNSQRRGNVLLGIATLILPENGDNYEPMIRRFIDWGIDYIYLNPVESSYGRWGIRFSADQRRKTLRFLERLPIWECGATTIRYPGRLNLDDPAETVYLDARKRANPEVCGSALWNPAVITTDTPGLRGARVLSCRSSQNFRDPTFWYVDGWSSDETLAAGTQRGLGVALRMHQGSVMRAASDCRQCRLERQVTMFGSAISLMKLHGFRGELLLDFRREDLRAVPS